MTPDSGNPYAPPNPVAPLEAVQLDGMENLTFLRPILFSGRVGQRELDEYLRTDGQVGCARLAILAIGFGGILLVLPILGGPFLAISAGAMGILAIVLTVSTLAYRRLIFKNVNPNWDESIRGEVQREGIRLHREHSSTLYHWKWYGASVVSDNVVAFVPATQTGVPLLITREMIASHDDWELLGQVTHEIATQSNRQETEDFHRDQNLRILKNQKRGWTFVPPADAIAFEGIVWSDDYTLLPRGYRSRSRPLRTYVVIYGLVAFIGLILAGCSGLLFEQIAILPILVTVYFVAMMVMRRLRRQSGNEVIFYLRGYSLDTSLVTDFGLAVSETAWPGLSMVVNRAQSVVLRRCDFKNFVVIRMDMFASAEAWNQFRDLVAEKLGPGEPSH